MRRLSSRSRGFRWRPWHLCFIAFASIQLVVIVFYFWMIPTNTSDVAGPRRPSSRTHNYGMLQSVAESAADHNGAVAALEDSVELLERIYAHFDEAKLATEIDKLVTSIEQAGVKHAGELAGAQALLTGLQKLEVILAPMKEITQSLQEVVVAGRKSMPHRWVAYNETFITAAGDIDAIDHVYLSIAACRQACEETPECQGIVAFQGKCQRKSQAELADGEGWYAEVKIAASGRAKMADDSLPGSSARELVVGRLTRAVAEAKRMVKVGKHARVGGAEQQTYSSALVRDLYPDAVLEGTIEDAVRRRSLSVGTLNLWGPTDWERRRPALATLLASEALDIIGFQEVRSTGAGGTSNQVEELRSAAALTGHTVVFQPCHQVGKPKGKEIEGPETWEGLALLSRLPILSHAMVVLPKSDRWSTDNNQRCALRVTLDVSSVAPGLGGLQVFVTHLSYADTQQCLNTAALLYWMNEELVRGAGIDGERMVAQVLMGDLNTYFGYEWPLEIMLREKNDPLKLHTLNPCTAVQTEPQLLRELSPTRVLLPATSVPPFAEWPSHHQEASALRDAWTALFAENKPGFTFSNVGDVTKLYDDNPPCRADRILVRGPIFPVAARTIGRDPLSLFVTPPSEEVLLSDHLGVAVMLALATSEVAASQAQVRVLKSRRDIEEGQKRVTDADKRLHDRAAELLVVVNEDHVATESGDESKMVISRNKVKHAKRQHSTEMSALEREKENYQSILQNLIPP